MMNYYDVSRDDEMVVDNEGTIWVAQDDDRWGYVTEGGVSSWDSREELPREYTYTKLDESARRFITKGLKAY